MVNCVFTVTMFREDFRANLGDLQNGNFKFLGLKHNLPRLLDRF